MSVRVPEEWASSEEPTAEVCIAEGYECEHIRLTAAECWECAEQLRAASIALSRLARDRGRS